MKRVLIIGPSPNRIGGVSTHINRLSSLLNDVYEFDYIDEGRKKQNGYFNLRSLNLWIYCDKFKKADIIHIHSAVFILRLFHVLMGRIVFRKHILVSIHHDLKVEGHIKTTRALLKLCNCAILDSLEIYNSVYSKESACIYRIMPAFLPPVENTEDELPSIIDSWIKDVKSNNNTVLMCSSSYSIDDYNGFDLYGNDMSINAVRVLNNKKTGRIFYLLMIVHNSDKNSEKLIQYQNMIENGLRQNVMLVTKPISFLRVMKASDVVLRPTNTDGDSITIREALYFSKAIVASDCAVRPEGTYVFKTRDLDDFCEKIIMSLDDNVNHNRPVVDYRKFYIECYENGSSIRE